MNILKKFLQSGAAILSIVAIVCLLLAFGVLEYSTEIFVPFFIGAALLIIGQTLFLTGVDFSIIDFGKHTGKSLIKLKKLWIIIIFGFVFGALVTIAEPDVQVLVGQIVSFNSFISSWLLLSVLGIGAGIFLAFALFKVLKRIPLKYCLSVLYAIIFILALLAPKEYFAIAFDAGGASTGIITVPFLLALVIGVCSIKGSKSNDDNFGTIAIVSAGPIISLLILGIIFGPPSGEIAVSTQQSGFLEVLTSNLLDTAIAIAPLLIVFILFQIFLLKLPKREFLRILSGFIIVFIGLVIFLTGVSYGFSPMGNYVGKSLAGLNVWLICLIGAVLGFLIVFTEPAIFVLAKEVEDITNKFLRKSIIYITLGIGIAISVVLALLHTVYDISLWYIIFPLFVLNIILSFIVPPIFSAIGFDSGGIASGALSAAFILPLCIGLSSASANSSMASAFGVIGIIATVPIFTVEMLGLMFMLKSYRRRKKNERKSSETEGKENAEKS